MAKTTNVTLIMGAGASKDINHTICTGEELIKDIASRITDRNTPGDQHLSKNLQYPQELKVQFLTYIDNYINSVDSPSIDEFLNEINTYTEFEANRNDFLTIGYVMILAHIFGFEGSATQEAMFNKDTWLTRLSEYIDKNEILTKNIEDGLRIITFNYDRIIEYYLLEKYNYSNEIIHFVNENVYHVYGRAGCLQGLTPKSLGNNVIENISNFGEENHKLKEFAEKYMSHIRLLYDNRNDTAELKSIIENSNLLCVFGYGFDSINNRRLGLQNCYDKKSRFKANIYSGGYPNFNFPHRRKMSEKIRGLVIDADIHYESCSDFLRKCLEV